MWSKWSKWSNWSKLTEKSMKLETSPKVTKSKRNLHWCRSISNKNTCAFFITVSVKKLLHYRARGLLLTFLDHLLVQGRPVFESSSIFGHVPCLQSVGISLCLPVCCPSISFSVGLGSFSQRPLVLAILHRCGWVLASSSGQTTLVFCFPGKFQQVLREPPSRCLHF